MKFVLHTQMTSECGKNLTVTAERVMERWFFCPASHYSNLQSYTFKIKSSKGGFLSFLGNTISQQLSLSSVSFTLPTLSSLLFPEP